MNGGVVLVSNVIRLDVDKPKGFEMDHVDKNKHKLESDKRLRF